MKLAEEETKIMANLSLVSFRFVMVEKRRLILMSGNKFSLEVLSRN